VREPARVTPGALSLLERVARLRGALRGRGVGVVREPAIVASGAFAFLEGVARGFGTATATATAATAALGVREPARVTPGALAFLERVAHGSAAAAATAAEAAAAAAAAAAFAVREPALVASGAFAFLEGVAHRAGRRAFAEPRLLRVLALRAPRGLIFPALGLVELLFPRRERELGVAVAAAQSDVFVLLGKRVRIRRGLGVHLEAILLVLRVFAGSFLLDLGLLGVGLVLRGVVRVALLVLLFLLRR